MATGTELYLAIQGMEDVNTVLADLGLIYDWDDGRLSPEATLDAIDATLKVAHSEALTELGMLVSSLEDPHFVVVRGLDDVLRQTSVWTLEVDYDPDEMGDKPEHAIVGVSLISRYFPVFLDWNQNHGGSGEMISLTPTTLEWIAVARKHIARVLPFINDAPITVKERHY